MASCLKDHNLCKHFKNACHSNANLPVSEDTIHNEEVAVDDLPGADDDSLRVPDHDWQAVQVIEEPEYELLQCESGAVLREDLLCQATEEVERQDPKTAEVKKRTNAKNVKKINKRNESFLKCPWTKNHESKSTLNKEKTILKLAVKDKFGVPAAGLQVLEQENLRRNLNK